MIPVADSRGDAVCGFPYKNGQVILDADAIGIPKSLVEIRRIGNDDSVLVGGEIQCFFGAEVRLVRKDVYKRQPKSFLKCFL